MGAGYLWGDFIGRFREDKRIEPLLRILWFLRRFLRIAGIRVNRRNADGLSGHEFQNSFSATWSANS